MLRSALSQLNEHGWTKDYGPLPLTIDPGDIRAIRKIQEVGIAMRTDRGDPNPLIIESRVAHAIVRLFKETDP